MTPAIRWYEHGRLIASGAQQHYAIVAGSGAPTVVFEAGLSSSAAVWEAVAPVIQAHACCCAYDRAGVGRSPAGPGPRSALQLAEELWHLLQATQLSAPYVLVGHSFGGLVTQLLATLQPALIAGLVLVDTPHPAYRQRMAALLPAGGWDAWMQPWNSEGVDLELSFVQLARVTLPVVPMVILTAGQHNYPPEWPTDRCEALRRELQRDLAHQLPHAQQRIITDCDHHIPLERPDAVVAAIRELLGGGASALER